MVGVVGVVGVVSMVSVVSLVRVVGVVRGRRHSATTRRARPARNPRNSCALSLEDPYMRSTNTMGTWGTGSHNKGGTIKVAVQWRYTGGSGAGNSNIKHGHCVGCGHSWHGGSGIPTGSPHQRRLMRGWQRHQTRNTGRYVCG